MRFWDSSAVVTLIVPQASTERMREIYREDSVLVIWCLTPIEIWSAICRLRRQGAIDSPRHRSARHRLRSLLESWVEIDDLRAVRRVAERLLETHALRAADALQLAAAIVLVDARPERVPFVTLDGRLAEAAEREGFGVEGVVPGTGE